jgi:hypothetical protein
MLLAIVGRWQPSQPGRDWIGIGVGLAATLAVIALYTAAVWRLSLVLEALFYRPRMLGERGESDRMNKWISGKWLVDKTNAMQRRVIHYWLTIIWFTVGSVLWIILRNDLWFVGFMSLYAIWITHLAGWAAETPVQSEQANSDTAASPAHDDVSAIGAPLPEQAQSQ